MRFCLDPCFGELGCKADEDLTRGDVFFFSDPEICHILPYLIWQCLRMFAFFKPSKKWDVLKNTVFLLQFPCCFCHWCLEIWGMELVWWSNPKDNWRDTHLPPSNKSTIANSSTHFCWMHLDFRWWNRQTLSKHTAVNTSIIYDSHYQKAGLGPMRSTNLLGGLEHFLFSIIYGIILPIDFHIFQDG